MNQKDVNDLLHKSPGNKTTDELPVCKICGDKFLGYPSDKICLECELEVDDGEDK